MSGPRGTGDKSFCCLKLEPSLEPRRSGTALRKAQKRSFATPFDAMQSRSDLSSFVPSQTSITRTRGECEEGQEGLSSSHLHVPAGKGELTSRLACYQLGNYSSLCDYSSNCYCHCYCCCCYCYCYGYRLPATGYRLPATATAAATATATATATTCCCYCYHCYCYCCCGSYSDSYSYSSSYTYAYAYAYAYSYSYSLFVLTPPTTTTATPPPPPPSPSLFVISATGCLCDSCSSS